MATMFRRLFGIKSSIEKKIDEQKFETFECEKCDDKWSEEEEYNGMIGDENWEMWVEQTWIVKIRMMETIYGIMCNNPEEWESGSLLLKKEYDAAAIFLIDYFEIKLDFIDDFKVKGIYDNFPRCQVLICDEHRFIVSLKSLSNYSISVYKDDVVQEFNSLRDAFDYVDSFY